MSLLIRGSSDWWDTTRRIISMDAVQMIEAKDNDVNLVAYVQQPSKNKDLGFEVKEVILGQFWSHSNGNGAVKEIDKIQREYQKFYQTKTAFFDPPKIYQVGRGSSYNCYDVTYTNINWNSRRLISGNRVYIDIGIGIKCTDDWVIPISPSKYSVIYPYYQGSGNHNYSLTFRLNNGGGTYTVGFQWDGISRS